jgi:ATP-dependent exoDNAse (exonuclease V) beta subunit
MEVGGDRDPTFDFIASLESQRAGFEEARLLYVGATRARESLHLFGEAKVKEVGNERIVVPTANSLLATLWPAVAADFEAVLTTHEINEPEVDYQAASAGIRRLSPDWQLPPRGDELVWNAEPTQPNLERQVLEFQWASPVIRHVGTVVHLLLQRIAQQGLDHWSRLAGGETSGLEVEIARHLSALGVAAADMSNALSLVQTALNNTLADERGRWLLGDTHQEPSNEYRISGVEHGQIVNVRIDRSFIDLDEQRWIIDYKTSAHRGGDREGFLDNEQERYREQLEGYARIVSALDSRSIRCGLYFPLLGGWREWRPALS